MSSTVTSSAGGGNALASDSIGFWRNVAQPVSAQAPIAGSALIPATMASVTGGSGVLSFLLGMCAGAMLVYIFASLARQFASAGALYYYAGMMVGIRLAFLVGWSYMMAHLLFSGSVVSQTAGYFTAGIELAGGGQVNWLIFAVVAWAAAMFLISRRVAIPTIVQLWVEGAAAIVVIVIGVIVLAKGGYNGDHFGFQYFTLGDSTAGQAFQGIAIAFAGMGGFESGAALGEETTAPKRTVPLTMWTALGFSGFFYTFAAWVENVGFADHAALANSSAPLFEVITTYVSRPVAVVVAFLTMFSAFGSIMGCSTSGTRTLYAMARDGFLNGRAARTHETERSPIGAIILWLVPSLALSVGFFAIDAGAAFGIVVTIGAYLLTFTYLLVVLGAMVFFYRRRSFRHVVVAASATAMLGFSLYSSLTSASHSAGRYLPYISASIVLAGIAIILCAPGLRQRLARSPYWSAGPSTTQRDS